jgi:exodeoxyribonuclease VII small subunit
MRTKTSQSKEAGQGLSAAEQAQITAMTFEQAMSALEEETARLSSGDQGLAESLSSYERGVALLRHAQALLTHVEETLAVIDAQGQASQVSRSTLEDSQP